MQKLIHYLHLTRIHRPIGIFLLLWPTLWALWIANHGMPTLKILIIFILGTIVMRSAGCVMNDIADRHFDKHVVRTKNRPLTSGKISLKEAIYVLCFLLSIAFLLVLQLNFFTIALSFVAVLLAAVYPLMKRFTYWPQAILGIAFGWGIPMAFAAQNQPLNLSCWLLLTISLFWALVYDTEYAMADRDDDILIGIKSTAIKFGRYDKLILSFLQLIVLLLLIALGCLIHAHWIYFASIAISSGFFIYQQRLIKDRAPLLCFNAFSNNNWLGLVIFVGLLLNYIK